MKSINRKSILLVGLFTGITILAHSQETEPLKLAEKVAGRIITDTRFEFKLVPQQEVLGVQVIDARFLPAKANELIYALRYATALKDTVVQFGINTGNDTRIWVN